MKFDNSILTFEQAELKMSGRLEKGAVGTQKIVASFEIIGSYTSTVRDGKAQNNFPDI